MEKILLLESSNLYISKASIWTQKKLDPGNNRKFQRNRIMGESLIHGLGAEPSQQQVAAAPAFDLRRAESSRQHVRALNTQFASWVQSQLQNHPDELWEDGVRDYLAHASSILENFSDVVNWLKANATNDGNLSTLGTQNAEKMVPETRSNETKLLPLKSVFGVAITTPGFTTSWSLGISSNSQASTLDTVLDFAPSWSSAVSSTSQASTMGAAAGCSLRTFLELWIILQ